MAAHRHQEFWAENLADAAFPVTPDGELDVLLKVPSQSRAREEPSGSDNTSDLKKSLLDLSNELLHNIGDFLPPAGFNSFAQTCHYLYAACNPRLYRQYHPYVSHWVAFNGRKDTAARALEYTKDAEGKYQFLSNLLSMAAEQRHIDLIRFLISKGADVNQREEFGRTALAQVMPYGEAGSDELELIELLLEQESIDLTNETNDINVFQMAIKHNIYVIVDRLLQCTAFCDAYINTTFMSGLTPLGTAAQYGFNKIIELLISHGVDINQDTGNGKTALARAIESNKPNAIMLLLQQEGIDLTDKNGSNVFQTAITHNNDAVVDWLLKSRAFRDAHINARFQHDLTPLGTAAQYGFDKIIERLISHGADINQDTGNGKTALAIAIDGNKPNAIMLLLQQEGIDLTAKLYHMNMFESLISSNNYAGIKWLLQFPAIRDAYINTRFEDGLTPLGIAAYGGLNNMYELLISHGADENQVVSFGMTAMEIFIERTNA